MEISEAIRTKRAVREFQDKALPDEVVWIILASTDRKSFSAYI